MTDATRIGAEPFIVSDELEALTFEGSMSFDEESFPERRFSWVGTPYLAAVSDQRPYNTCTSHALARAHETLRRQKGAAAARLGAEQFHQCVLGMHPSAGVTNVVPTIQAFCDTGAPVEDSSFEPGGRCPNPPAPGITCSGAKEIADEQTAKRAIREFRPIMALMTCEQRFLSFSGPGIYRDGSGPKSLHHAVLLVGFDEAERCWEVQNSMGTGWGRSGRGRVAYGHGSLFSDADHVGFLLC